MSGLFKWYFVGHRFYFKLKYNGPTRIVSKMSNFDDGYRVLNYRTQCYCHEGNYKSLIKTYPTIFKNYSKEEFDKYIMRDDED